MALVGFRNLSDGEHRTPLAVSESVHALVAGSSPEITPAAGHLSNIDNPDGFHAAIDPFMNRVAA